VKDHLTPRVGHWWLLLASGAAASCAAFAAVVIVLVSLLTGGQQGAAAVFGAECLLCVLGGLIIARLLWPVQRTQLERATVVNGGARSIVRVGPLLVVFLAIWLLPLIILGRDASVLRHDAGELIAIVIPQCSIATASIQLSLARRIREYGRRRSLGYYWAAPESRPWWLSRVLVALPAAELRPKN
jgi:hypothetical protein